MADKLKTGGWRADPIYEYVFRNKIQPYVDYAKTWWKKWQEEVFYETGSYPAKNAPPGMFIRFSRTLAHSPVNGIQAFPYVAVPFLQLHHIPGGARKMVDELCHQHIIIEGLVLCERKYLHGTQRNGQFIALIPEKLLKEVKTVRGRYIWLNGDDLLSLSMGVLDKVLQRRFMLLCGEDYGHISLNIDKEKTGDRETLSEN